MSIETIQTIAFVLAGIAPVLMYIRSVQSEFRTANEKAHTDLYKEMHELSSACVRKDELNAAMQSVKDELRSNLSRLERYYEKQEQRLQKIERETIDRIVACATKKKGV